MFHLDNGNILPHSPSFTTIGPVGNFSLSAPSVDVPPHLLLSTPTLDEKQRDIEPSSVSVSCGAGIRALISGCVVYAGIRDKLFAIESHIIES